MLFLSASIRSTTFSPRGRGFGPIALPWRFALMPEGPLRAARTHHQADRDARDHALSLGASGRGEVRRPVHAGGFFFEPYIANSPSNLAMFHACSATDHDGITEARSMNDPGNNQRKGDLVTGPLPPNPRSVARHGARHLKSSLKKERGRALGPGPPAMSPPIRRARAAAQRSRLGRTSFSFLDAKALSIARAASATASAFVAAWPVTAFPSSANPHFHNCRSIP
jgi:hypothetical protein